MRKDGLPEPSNHSEMYLAAILDELRLPRNGEPRSIPDPNQGTLDLVKEVEPAPEIDPTVERPRRRKGG